MLFEKYANKMMATCMRYCKNQEDARDLLHDGFYKIFTNIKSFKGDSRIDTWMTRVIINSAQHVCRRQFVSQGYSQATEYICRII